MSSLRGLRRAKLSKPMAWLAMMVLAASATAQTVESYTFTTNRLLLDGNAAGLADVRTLNSSIVRIASVTARLKLAGEFNGDVYAYLTHSNGFSVLLNRVGRSTTNTAGYADYGFDVTLQSDAVNGDIHFYRNVVNPGVGQALTGIWQPDGRIADPGVVTEASPRASSLTNFIGLNAAGDWTLYLVDLESGGTNQLTEWGLEISGVATPALTWAPPAAITYGTALSEAQLNATVTYNGTNVPGTLAYAPTTGTILNAGNGQPLAVTFTPADTNSFQTLSANVAIDVSRAPLTITANNTNKTYGSSVPQLTASYSGFVNGDTSSSLATPPTLATTATLSSPAGNYPITASGASNSNYIISYANGTLAVDAALLTVTVQNATKAFGAALPVFSANYSGFMNGDTTNQLNAMATFATPANVTSDVGVYAITASSASSSNYTFQYVAGHLTITQALTSVSIASSQQPVAAGSNVTFTAALTALAPGAGTPSGSVLFRVDGNAAGTTTLSSGIATFTTADLSHGSHSVIAEYSGDDNFVGSTNSLTAEQSVNSAPVATDDTIERYPDQGVKVRLATLLANDTDADTDALSIAISAESTHGGSLSVSGDWVFYTPASGFTNTDSFTYTLTDGFGGTTTGTVHVLLKEDNDPGQNLTIASLGNGSVVIRGNGIPGRTYHLEYSDTLAPFNWQALPGADMTADSNGGFQWVDTGLTGNRFYRSVYR